MLNLLFICDPVALLIAKQFQLPYDVMDISCGLIKDET